MFDMSPDTFAMSELPLSSTIARDAPKGQEISGSKTKTVAQLRVFLYRRRSYGQFGFAVRQSAV
jgi:hypothetical protein